MKFGVMGTGGVGGYFGGTLGRAGVNVAFVARGAHLKALRGDGLRVESVKSGNFTVTKAVFTDDPAEAGICDVVLFCVKTTSNDAAIAAIHPMMGADTVVITLQNGVDNPQRLAATYGEERVMGGVAYVFASLAGPGLVRQTGGPGKLVFGELVGGASARGKRILEILQSAGVDAALSPDIHVELWKKFIFICAVSGMTALTRSSVGEVLAYEGTAKMTREIMREVYQVGVATGIGLPDDMDETNYRFLLQQNPASKGSLCHDLEAGRRLEIEALCGAVSRLGREKKVSTPLNDFLYHSLKLADLKAEGFGG